MGKDSRSDDDEKHRRIVRLAVALRRLSDKRPDLVPRFLAARKRPVLLALHAFMGLGPAAPNTSRAELERRHLEADEFSHDVHHALLCRLWPAVYLDPPTPAAASATSFAELIALRSTRRRTQKSLYADGDRIEIADEHRRRRAVPIPRALASVMGRERVSKPTTQTVREPRVLRFPEFDERDAV